jgi:hypothetical protein
MHDKFMLVSIAISRYYFNGYMFQLVKIIIIKNSKYITSFFSVLPLYSMLVHTYHYNRQISFYKKVATIYTFECPKKDCA